MTRRYRGRTVARTTVTRGNRYAGACHYCGDTVAPMAGIAEKPAGSAEWRVMHRPSVWVGSPVSGRWEGGCPGDGDALNAAGVTKPEDSIETFDTDAGGIDMRVIPGELSRATVDAARAALAETPALKPSPSVRPEAATVHPLPPLAASEPDRPTAEPLTLF